MAPSLSDILSARPLQKFAVFLMLVGALGGLFTAAAPFVRDGGLASLALAGEDFLLGGFKAVPVLEASAESREAALVFRSVLPSLADPDGPEGRWLSLNPADTRFSPLIYDGEKEKIRRVSTDFESFSRRGGKVLELGPFSQGLAAARAFVPPAENEPRKAEGLWGFVDTDGHWVVPPAYAEVKPFTNGLALAGQKEENGLAWKLLDRHGNTRSSLGAGHWYLKALGRHVALHGPQNEASLFRFSADKGWAEAGEKLPGWPSKADPGGSLLLIEDRIYGLYRVGQGMVLDLSQERARQNSEQSITPLLADVYGKSGDDNGSRRHAIHRLAAGAPLALGLSAVQPLTTAFFIACTEGSPSPVPASDGWSDQRYNQGARCGLMDAEGKWRQPPAYHTIVNTGDGFIRLGKGRAWCLAGADGSLLQACSEKPAGALLSTGLMADVHPESGRLGYRNSQGEWAIPPGLQVAGDFMGNIARVYRQGEEGLIDPDGRWLTPEKPASLPVAAWERLAKSGQREGGMGVIDRQGAWVVPPAFRHIQAAFEKGQVRGCTGFDDTGCPLMDLGGRPLPDERQGKYDESLAAGITVAGLPEIVPSALNGVWGYADRQGKWVIEPAYAAAEEFSEGLAAVAESAGKEPAGEPAGELEPLRWGYVDVHGKGVIATAFEAAAPFSGGAAWVKQGGRWGLMDPEGKWRVSPRFDEYSSLAGGTAWARDGSGLYLVKANGEVKPLAAIREISRFAEGDLVPAFDGQRWGYMDGDGNWAIEPRFSRAEAFVGGHAVAAAESLWDWQPATAESSPYLVRQVKLWRRAGVAAVTVADKAGGRIGLVDREGRWLLPRLR